MHTPAAQLLGRWRFDYAIVPHASVWTDAYHEAHRLNRRLRAIRVSRGRDTCPREGGLLDLKPADFIVSTVKPAEDRDGVAVRLYNIADEPRVGRLRMLARSGEASRVNLNEEEPSPVAALDGGITLALRQNEIATVRFAVNDG
jgi:alpha-mannosidase